MFEQVLEPRLDLLCQEYVLVQAWKKTSNYIRYHNWYSDTLELDRTSVNLPRFLSELGERLQSPETWVSDPLRIVPAPKSQQWRVRSNGDIWEPVEKGKTASKLRPLAHVSLMDQVAASAVMICLADRAETLQSDPRDSVSDPERRRSLISYGNRLFCDKFNGELRHRWGSSKLYRAYYQDYQSFLLRPEFVAENDKSGNRVVIVHSDLRQFYDRVRPALMAQKLKSLEKPSDDQKFFDFSATLLNWKWDKKDSKEVAGYAAHAGLADFSRVALPQGLVSAGFFANIVLLDFDQALRNSIGLEIVDGIRILDSCRYVDDLRFVLHADRGFELSDIEGAVSNWLQTVLDSAAPGLEPSPEKTRAAAIKGDERPLVRQSRKMARIQSAVSGGFDAIGGEEILDAVQGLIRSQQRYSEQRTPEQGWSIAPIADVRDATVARFAAARYRSTFRSLRPLLGDRTEIQAGTGGEQKEFPDDRGRNARTRSDIDDEARAFALGLIENWVEDPSNVRLLRIGLDLWPAEDVLRKVLGLLRPLTDVGGKRKAPRRVAWYCLSEIFRAAATETGFVEDNESLPDGINILTYRATLREEAIRLASMSPATLPWYLRQQVLLFLATSGPSEAPVSRTGTSQETKHYRELIRYLRGEGARLKSADFATLAVLARRSFVGKDIAINLAAENITSRRLEQIAERDPDYAVEIIEEKPEFSGTVSARVRDDLCLVDEDHRAGIVSLSHIVLRAKEREKLRNELTLVGFAARFLEAVIESKVNLKVVCPADVWVQFGEVSDGSAAYVKAIEITQSRASEAGSMYLAPPWCSDSDRWRFHLGYLLRFILSARADFTKTAYRTRWREGTDSYRAPDNHWYQRLYGLYNGHSAFGDDWLPISEWLEGMLAGLLSWPGCRESESSKIVSRGIAATLVEFINRFEVLRRLAGPSSNTLFVPLSAPWPVTPQAERPLRACVIQTVIPGPDDFVAADPTLDSPEIRKRHRNHLSAALAAIERMLDLRETHHSRDGRLDLLILPELSVHPRDVRTHLLPFARSHKTIILAGLTYETIVIGQPAVNSAIWIIPVWSPAHGLQVLTRRQGKKYLAPMETELNATGKVIQGFRPCQWLVSYNWSNNASDKPLAMTASICYDATDLRLAADMRKRSDVFVIPALNKDVTTFDQMALALHYHMFQMVIVANNGLFGGSNAYVPFKKPYKRQLFHLHGQPQASVAFLEIDNIRGFIQERQAALGVSGVSPLSDDEIAWKSPPAGMKD
jgi:hypothetical protein